MEDEPLTIHTTEAPESDWHVGGAQAGDHAFLAEYAAEIAQGWSCSSQVWVREVHQLAALAWWSPDFFLAAASFIALERSPDFASSRLNSHATFWEMLLRLAISASWQAAAMSRAIFVVVLGIAPLMRF